MISNSGNITVKRRRERNVYAAICGAGELSIIPLASSTSMLLRSLGSALLPFGFMSLEPVLSLLTSPEKE